jgi:hypothetical protein
LIDSNIILIGGQTGIETKNEIFSINDINDNGNDNFLLIDYLKKSKKEKFFTDITIKLNNEGKQKN